MSSMIRLSLMLMMHVLKKAQWPYIAMMGMTCLLIKPYVQHKSLWAVAFRGQDWIELHHHAYIIPGLYFLCLLLPMQMIYKMTRMIVTDLYEQWRMQFNVWLRTMTLVGLAGVTSLYTICVYKAWFMTLGQKETFAPLFLYYLIIGVWLLLCSYIYLMLRFGHIIGTVIQWGLILYTTLWDVRYNPLNITMYRRASSTTINELLVFLCVLITVWIGITWELHHKENTSRRIDII